MLAALLLIAAQSETPVEIISKMFAKYAYADTLSGTVTYTVSDGAGKVSVKTDVKYVRPNLLLIKQDRVGANGAYQQAISDGAAFMYDLPIQKNIVPVRPNERFVEEVYGMYAETSIPFRHNIGKLYSIAHKSLSPSSALDIAIGFKPHLEDMQIHLSTQDKLQSATYKDKTVHKITGEWRVNRSTEMANGMYELLVSSEYDFLRLVHTARYNIGKFRPGDNFIDPKNIVTVTTTEVAEFVVNAKVGTKEFNFRKKSKYDPVLGWH